MPRSSSAITAEIAALETVLASNIGAYDSITDAATGRTMSRAVIQKRLDSLYQAYDRVASGGSMFARGRIQGLS